MDITHGKYLGVDYGDKRTGLAECDVSGLLASGIGTISEGGMKNTAERVAKEATARGCKKIIIGLPKNMDGTEGFRAEATYKFAKRLGEIYDGRIEFVDERLTTVGASQFLNATNTRGGKRKDVIDTVSACLILETYMKRKNNS